MKKLLRGKRLKLICLSMLTIIFIVIVIDASCITPKGTLRTYLFKHGHPIIAFITPIVDDKLHNDLAENDLKLQNSNEIKNENIHYYTLIIAPREKATGGYLSNYAVKKIGFFYFVEYYGEA